MIGSTTVRKEISLRLAEDFVIISIRMLYHPYDLLVFQIRLENWNCHLLKLKLRCVIANSLKTSYEESFGFYLHRKLLIVDCAALKTYF